MIDRPWVFKIEMSKGCNFSCSFCPVSINPEYRDKNNRNFMTPEDCTKATKTLNNLNPNARIELTMRGEPTLSPYLEENVRLMRKYIPKCQISLFTNGSLFHKDKEMAYRLLHAGVNILNIDCYNNTYDRFAKLFEDSEYEVKDFRNFSAYRRYPKGERLEVINLVPDIGDPARLVKVRETHNMAGNIGKPLTVPLQKKCARPFREFTVMWDLNVVICCHDWSEELVLGNLRKETATAIWHGEKHRKILRMLYNKDRSMDPCSKCDYKGGFRLGFLKNPEEVKK
jgi:radical SAM protein with 4Fe4S-binding SPASM domain